MADVLVVAAAILLLLAYRRRHNRMDLVGAVAAAGVVAWDLSRWPALHVAVGWREAVLGVAMIVALFNLVGFPRLFVRMFKVGYRSREWDFDMRLYDEKERLDRLLLEYRSSEDWRVYRRWRANVMTRGSRIVRGIRRLKPPTPEWAHVRDGYVDLYEDILGRIVRDEAPDDADTDRRGTELKERAEILRIAYRTAALKWMRGVK